MPQRPLMSSGSPRRGKGGVARRASAALEPALIDSLAGYISTRYERSPSRDAARLPDDPHDAGGERREDADEHVVAGWRQPGSAPTVRRTAAVSAASAQHSPSKLRSRLSKPLR